MLLDYVFGAIDQSSFSGNVAGSSGGAKALMWSSNTGTSNI